jgi:hypothetical protein
MRRHSSVITRRGLLFSICCVISITVSKFVLQKLFFGIIAALLAFIIFFAVPAG